MANQAFYRQYRPKTFDEVKGQENIIPILKKQIEKKEPAHAYLFTGPRGTGKTSTARILAMALNCKQPQQGNPCLTCENCQAAMKDAMIDLVEIDAASNNSVDNAREIREKVNLLPAKGIYKIYIIDEVHMLSTSAFNALLKTLEEPPEHAVFILATTELRKLPATVLSRCQRFDFKRIADDTMVSRMEEILKQEGILWEEEALRLIAQQAEGGLRDALSILDKCCASAEKLDLEEVEQALGIAGGGNIRRLADALQTFDGAQALTCCEEILQGGVQSGTLVVELIQLFRQRMVQAAQAGEEQEARQAARAIEVLAETELKMKYAAAPAILLEAALVKIVLPAADGSKAETELRLRQVETAAERISAQIKEMEKKIASLPKGGSTEFSIEDIMGKNGIDLID